MDRIRFFALALVLVLGSTPIGNSPEAAPAAAIYPQTVHVFFDNDIHFTPDEPSRFDTEDVRSFDNGRGMTRTLTIDLPDTPVEIRARLTVHPIPADLSSVADKWDRAGNIRLRKPGQEDIEVIKFITAYGGRIEHTLDITHLAPLLDGECTFVGFIDTWVTPAWKIDLDIDILPERIPEVLVPWIDPNPTWVHGLHYIETLKRTDVAEGPITAEVVVPEELDTVVLNFLSSGHCTDGRGADEFESKDNVVFVDGKEVYRFQPWRSDCKNFRDVNPHCRKWADGSWSADFSRSGWCPGDVVLPHRIDLSESLTPGPHVVGISVEDIRPADDEGNHGYWRISSHLLGSAAPTTKE